MVFDMSYFYSLTKHISLFWSNIFSDRLLIVTMISFLLLAFFTNLYIMLFNKMLYIRWPRLGHFILYVAIMCFFIILFLGFERLIDILIPRNWEFFGDLFWARKIISFICASSVCALICVSIISYIDIIRDRWDKS